MFKDAKEYDVNLQSITYSGFRTRPGWKMPAEHKRKIGDANRGQVRGPLSEETRRKLTNRFWEGKSYREWAQHYGVTTAAIAYRMKKNGNPHPYETDFSNCKGTKPSVFYEGLSVNEWATKLSVGRGVVSTRLKEYGHPYGKRVCKQMGLSLMEKK